LFTFCQMTVLLIIHWKCFSMYKLLHRTIPTNTFCIIKSTVIWQNVNKFPIYFFNIQQIFLFIFRIYRSFSIFSQKYVIKRFTWLNTISNFIKLFHVGPGHRQKPCTIILNEVLPKSRIDNVSVCTSFSTEPSLRTHFCINVG
jgi:hypothetical protein